MKKLFLIAGVLAALSGCASIAAPQSLSEQLAYGYAGVASVRTTCAQQVTSTAMSVAAGTDCLNKTDTARTALDLASTATTTGDATTAVSQLAIATAILTQLQTTLNTGK